MAQPIGVSDPLAEELWSNKQHLENLEEIFFMKKGMASVEKADPNDVHMRSATNPVVIIEQMGSRKGQSVNLRLLKQLTRSPRDTSDGAKTRGDTSMVGGEESMVYMDCSVWLENLKNAVAMTDFDMAQLRTQAGLEQDARGLLTTWLVEELEEACLDAMHDGWNYNVIQQISGPAVTAHPTIVRSNGQGSTADVGGDTTAKLDMVELRRMYNWSRQKTITPVKHMGETCFVGLFSPQAITDLLGDSEFQAVFPHAAPRSEDNPAIKGYDYKYINMYICSYERIRAAGTSGAAAKVDVSFVLGGQSMALAFGTSPRIVMLKETKYDDAWGRAIRQIIGTRRLDYQTSDDSETLNQSSAQWELYSAREFAA